MQWAQAMRYMTSKLQALNNYDITTTSQWHHCFIWMLIFFLKKWRNTTKKKRNRNVNFTLRTFIALIFIDSFLNLLTIHQCPQSSSTRKIAQKHKLHTVYEWLFNGNHMGASLVLVQIGTVPCRVNFSGEII